MTHSMHFFFIVYKCISITCSKCLTSANCCTHMNQQSVVNTSVQYFNVYHTETLYQTNLPRPLLYAFAGPLQQPFGARLLTSLSPSLPEVYNNIWTHFTHID